MHQALGAWRQVEPLQGPQPLDVFEHVPRVWLGRRLAQPRQPGQFAAVLALEQGVQTRAMRRRQRRGERVVDATGGACDGLGTDALDHVQRRQQHALSAQFFHQGGRQYDPLVGLPGQFIQTVDRRPIVTRRREGLEPEDRL
jgi:hypothetical protein